MSIPVLLVPLKNNPPIISQFWEDYSDHPIRSKFYILFDNHHPGVDFGIQENTEVFSSFQGVVIRNEFHRGMGNVIGIRNGNIVALYAHLNVSRIKLGQIVEAGDLLGLSGNTGEATEPNVPHLHFEMRDITKSILKDMVFEPKFNQEIQEWQPQFTYIVKNENTPKTWKVLAERYIGDKSLWNNIASANPNLKVDVDEVLKDNTSIVIPNFQE